MQRPHDAQRRPPLDAGQPAGVAVRVDAQRLGRHSSSSSAAPRSASARFVRTSSSHSSTASATTAAAPSSSRATTRRTAHDRFTAVGRAAAMRSASARTNAAPRPSRSARCAARATANPPATPIAGAPAHGQPADGVDHRVDVARPPATRRRGAAGSGRSGRRGRPATRWCASGRIVGSPDVSATSPDPYAARRFDGRRGGCWPTARASTATTSPSCSAPAGAAAPTELGDGTDGRRSPTCPGSRPVGRRPRRRRSARSTSAGRACSCSSGASTSTRATTPPSSPTACASPPPPAAAPSC